ncbi:MAG: hypothetical protein ICV61_05100 [Microcoleus sp. Co-bin12]|nr:hypothetical protein [Microcoleus sp. Co-bin12]
MKTKMKMKVMYEVYLTVVDDADAMMYVMGQFAKMMTMMMTMMMMMNLKCHCCGTIWCRKIHF